MVRWRAGARRLRRAPSALGTLVVCAAALAAAPARHPLHTTLTELTYDRATRTVTARIRTFTEDFAPAAARAAGVRPGADHAIPDAVALAYVRASLSLAGPRGRPLRLDWCGTHRQGDVTWLCVRAAAPDGLSGLRVQNRLLFEVFDDQVNIVQATSDGRRQSLLFTRDEGEKRLK